MGVARCSVQPCAVQLSTEHFGGNTTNLGPKTLSKSKQEACGMFFDWNPSRRFHCPMVECKSYRDAASPAVERLQPLRGNGKRVNLTRADKLYCNSFREEERSKAILGGNCVALELSYRNFSSLRCGRFGASQPPSWAKYLCRLVRNLIMTIWSAKLENCSLAIPATARVFHGPGRRDANFDLLN